MPSSYNHVLVIENMDWIIYSFIMYFFSVTLYLGLRKLQKDRVSNDINNPAMFFLCDMHCDPVSDTPAQA